MTIGKQIKWEKLKYDINGEAAGIKDLSSGKIDKSEHLFGRFRKKMTNIFKKLPLMSLLLICGKILEKLVFNEMFEVFIQNELISSNQLGFKLDNSYINQHLGITHELYKSGL